jgi:hypothetical protein
MSGDSANLCAFVAVFRRVRWLVDDRSELQQSHERKCSERFILVVCCCGLFSG